MRAPGSKRMLVAATLVTGIAALAAQAAEPPRVGFRLTEARTAPPLALFDGPRKPRLRYRFRAREPVSLRVVVARRSGRSVRAWRLANREPGPGVVRWDGLNRRGEAARDGRYRFLLGPVGGGLRHGGGFRLLGHVFPVRGPHGTRGAIGRFGAPRSGGRRHEGFDVTAACGTPLVAARGGRVQRAGYDAALDGHFLRIDTRRSREDHVYSHLRSRPRFRTGERVRTGARIGEVGNTGNARTTPCHLHFELRIRGRPVNPEPALRRWDRRT